MKIGISINGVLRDYLKQIEIVHSKYFPTLDENGEIDDDSSIKVNDYDLEKWVTFPKEEIKQGELTFNHEFTLDLTKENLDKISDVELTNKTEEVTIHEFLYERCTLEVFGSANEVIPNIMNVLNQLIIDYPQHEFVVISNEFGLSIPSTFFFLSKTSCMCSNIKFVPNNMEIWDNVDLMVTDHPEIIDNKPTDKICVVVDRPFNVELTSNYRIDNLKGLRMILEEITSNTTQ
jgi:hypothetical protein